MATSVQPDEERAVLLREEEAVSGNEQNSWCKELLSNLPTIAMDVVLSIPFYYFLLFLYIPDKVFYAILGGLLVLMILWRIYLVNVREPLKEDLALNPSAADKIPYPVGHVRSNDRDLYLVATIHISPKAPLDVAAVVENVSPDIVMIELDDERLDRMREAPTETKERVPKTADLQSIQVEIPGKDTLTMHAQRALWNAERKGDDISGPLVFDKNNVYGLETPSGLPPNGICLVERGGPEGVFAAFAVKADIGARAGAAAMVVINKDDKLPLSRIGGSTLKGDLQTMMKTGSCGFPSIPCLMVTQTDGQQLLQALEESNGNGNEGSVHVQFQIKDDHYPRRTLRKRLCQACAFVFSGIGILYGIIQCFGVEVGGEFLAAEVAAKEQGVLCACIDSDLDNFWTALGSALLPTPRNIIDAILAWLAFPRVAFRALFPPRSNVDCFGSMILHAFSFRLRTWVSFFLAGYAASFVTSHVMAAFTNGAELAAEKTGTVKKEDRVYWQSLFAIFLQLYMLPRIYDGVAATRDEVMYQSIVAKCRRHGSKRMVAVVGAGHANGILQRARTRGL